MRVVAGLVVALVGLVGCGRVDFALGPEPDAPPSFGPFGTPQPITILDSTLNDADPTLTDDQLEMYFSSNRPNGLGQTDIYRYDVASGTTTRVTNTPDSEYSPTMTPDGGHISVIRGFRCMPTSTPFRARRRMARATGCCAS